MGCLSFLLTLALGIALFREAKPGIVLLAWGTFIVFFVVVRAMGLATSLRRGDALPLDSLLHLPFSPHQVFLLNFALSQLTLSTVIFVPAFAGMGLAAAIALDFYNVVLIPASLAVVLCVAALLYQLQGWIVSAMVRARHRVVLGWFLLIALVLLVQIFTLTTTHQRQDHASQFESTEVVATSPDHVPKTNLLVEVERNAREETGESSQWLKLKSSWVARGSANGSGAPWSMVIVTISLLAVTVLSLRRSYRCTLARYRDGDTLASHPRHARTAREWWWPALGLALGSPVLLIARVTSRQWWRSVQGKVVVQTAALMSAFALTVMVVFPERFDAETLPLMMVPAMMIVGVPLHLSCNMFAYDGHGFRLYRFAGVSPRILLLGKCMALLPQLIVLFGAALIVMAVAGLLSPTDALATAFQGGVVYLVSSAVGCALSMRYPYAVPLTSMNVNPGASAVLAMLVAQVAVGVCLVLIVAGVLAVEEALHEAGHALPVYLVLSMLEFGVLVLCFRLVLRRLARELVERSDRILDAVRQST